MGTRHVPLRFRGLIKPDDRLSFWASESGLFDALGVKVLDHEGGSPLAGQAQPQQTISEMGLRASGQQTEDIDVYINRSGIARIDSAGALWKLQGEADSEYRGDDLHVPVAAWDRLATATAVYDCHVCQVDDYVIGIYKDQTVGAAGDLYSTTRAPTDEVFSSWAAGPAVHNDGTYFGACIVPLPSGRVIVYDWDADGADHQIRLWYSDDYGASWQDGGWVLPDAIDSVSYYPYRIRAAYNEGTGQMVVFAHLRGTDTGTGIYRARIAQYASSDGGMHLEQVVISTGADADNAGGYPDVVVHEGCFVFGRLSWDAGTGTVTPRFRRLQSAYTPWPSGDDDSAPVISSAQDWGIRQAAPVDFAISEGELSMWVDDDGAIYATGRHCAGANDGACPVLRSSDGGDSWEVPGSHAVYAGRGQPWWSTGVPGPAIKGPDNEITNLAGCYHRGRAVVLGLWSRGGIAQHRLGAWWLGGWQTSPMPSEGLMLRPNRRTSWTLTGCGSHLPSEGPWALTLVGGGAEALVGDRVVHTCGVGDGAYDTYAPTTTNAKGIYVERALEVDSGTAWINLRISDATPIEYEIRVRVTPTTVELWDLKAGAQIGATYTHTHTKLRIRAAIDESGGAGRALCEVIGDDSAVLFGAVFTSPDRQWDQVASSGALASAAANPGARIQFGALASSVVYWDEWLDQFGAYSGIGPIGQTKLRKMPGCVTTTPRWAGHGLMLSSASGPALTGHRWLIDATDDRPPEALLPQVSPSPQHPYRSRDLSTVVLTGHTWRVAYRVGAVDELGLSTLWGAYLDGNTAGGGRILMRYGGAWHTVATITEWRCTATRKGRTLVVSSGGPLHASVIRRDELAGSLVEFVAGGVVTHQYRVVSNEPGHIDTSSGVSLPLKILLDGRDPAAPASPSVRIYPRRSLAIIDMEAIGSALEGIALEWDHNQALLGAPPPAVPPEGYYQAATFAAGPLWAWGYTHSEGYRKRIVSGTDLITAEDGTRVAADLHEAREIYELTWAEGVNCADFYQEPDPDYISATAAGAALAFWRSTPIDVEDQLRTLAGSRDLVVYCPRIDTGGGAWCGSSHRAYGAVLCRMTGAVELDNVWGDEEHDAQPRLQAVVLEQER